MQMLKLKNGAEEPAPLVMIVYTSLKSLIQEGIGGVTAVYDIAKMAEPNSTYKPFGSNGDKLKSLALLDDNGRMHDSIRNVVRSAIEISEDGFDFALVNPVASVAAPSVVPTQRPGSGSGF